MVICDVGMVVECRPGVLRCGKVVAECGDGTVVEGGEL